jgi:hypothetical protein
MPKLTAGKVMEATASLAAHAPGGTGEAAKRIAAYCEHFGVDFAHTDEETAGRRLSNLYMEGQRLNNGRGERLFDAVLAAPIAGMAGAVREFIPVSLKGGDSRDISTDIPFVQSCVEAGMPIWVFLLDAPGAQDVVYENGVRMDVPPAGALTMRRINVTPLLRDCIADWTKPGDSKAAPAFIRKAKVGEYVYLRLRVNWGSVPDHYWLDAAGPVPFDPAAPLPCPWWD